MNIFSLHLQSADRYALGVALALLSPVLSAQAPDAAITEIIVKGEQLTAQASPFSSSQFDSSRLRELNIVEPEALLDYVPGVNVKDYGLSGVADAITIRGFGGGGHGGDLGVVLDGIALNEAMSHADGYVDLNVIVPLEIESLNVLRGPVSALYGNYNRGGLVSVNTRKGGNYGSFDISAGGDGIADLQAVYGSDIGQRQALNLAAQYFRSDGFRPQSETSRGTLAGRWSMEFSDLTTLALSGRWHSAEGDNAAYLSQDQYRADPYGIDPNASDDGSEKDFFTTRADLSHGLTKDLQWLTFIYATRQDFTRWFSRPVDASWSQREETYDRDVEGAGTNLNGNNTWLGTEVTWVAGLESVREATYYQYYEGLNKRRRVAPAVMDREVELDASSAFYQAQIDWHPLFQSALGLRYDRFSGQCRAIGAESSSNPCESLNDLDHLSPKLGISSDLLTGLQLRASWAEGFALPGGWLKYQSQAANLDPVVFRQLELGVKLSPTSRFELDLAAYRVVSDGEIRTVAPGEYENYGETERTGIEASFSWWPLTTLGLTGVYASADSEITRSDDVSVIGNEVGGVADYSTTLRLDWQFLPAWGLSLDWRGVGGYALNAANAQYADSYKLLDFGMAYDHAGHRPWKLYLELNNLTDEVYASSQSTLGYATGAPRQLRIGVQSDF